MSKVKNNELTHTSNSGTSNIVMASNGDVTTARDLTTTGALTVNGTTKTGSLRGMSGSSDSIQLHASDQSVTFPGAVTITGALTSSTTGLGGLSEVDQWRLSADLQHDQDPIQTNLERVDTDGGPLKGTGMSVSSGIWTFPSTGFWEIRTTFLFYPNSGSSDNCYGETWVTTDNGSNWNKRGEAVLFFPGHTDNGVSVSSQLILDVTSTTNVKVKFKMDVTSSSAGPVAQGNTNFNKTNFVFLKLAET